MKGEMLPAGKKIKRDSTSESGEEHGSPAMGGRALLLFQLRDLRQEHEAATARPMRKGRSGGQREKETSRVQKQVD